MKITRVETLSFAVTDESEAKCKRRLERERPKGIPLLSRGGDITERECGYFPLVKFKVSRPEDGSSGIKRKEAAIPVTESYFFIDLTTCELYYRKGSKIMRYDLIKRVMDIAPEERKTLGRILRYGDTLYEDLNPDIIFKLSGARMVRVFRPLIKDIANAIENELNPDPKRPPYEVKKHVKVAFEFPRFGDPKFDLAAYFEAKDTIMDDYKKHPIHYPIDEVSKVISEFFMGEVKLEALVYLPFIQYTYSTTKYEGRKSELQFPLVRKGQKNAIYKTGEKLRPVSLGTGMGDEGVPVERSTINFSDVVNLENVKDEIRDDIIYPIMRPDLAKQFGKKGGGGILLYGPPGCGKTFIAKATIGECGVSFFNVNLSDIFSQGGESATVALHSIFEKACKSSPSIIFFDEIEAIGGRRGSEQTGKERRGVDQFLTEMDGVETMSENVLIIAATNSPWSIDPALKRSKRFSKQIFVPPPNTETREKLFIEYTKKEPIEEDIDFKKLAELTEGYSCSDIKEICDEAARIPWKEAIKDGTGRKITNQDFTKAITKQQSSLIAWFKLAEKEILKSGESDLYKDFGRDIAKYGAGVDPVEKPKISFSDIGGLKEVKEEIKRLVVYPMKYPELAREYYRTVGGGILLYGPPGCGKTYMAQATAGECDASFFNVGATDILSGEPGESERKIKEIFERASKNAPAIIFFDEIDALGGRRESVKEDESRRITNQLLVELDGFKCRAGVVVMAATNEPWGLDPALRRSGRFTQQILVPPPDLKARYSILKIHTKHMPLDDDADIERVADATEGYSGSDMKEICRAAADIPWEQAVRGQERKKITTDDLLNAVKRQKSSLIPWAKMAQKQLKESGEKEIYKDLFDMIIEIEARSEYSKDDIREIVKREKSRVAEEERTYAPPDETDILKKHLAETEDKRRSIMESIERSKYKYHKRELDEESFREIVRDYQKQLIGIEQEAVGMKNRLFEHKKEAIGSELESGVIYLATDETGQDSIALFTDLVSIGLEGLCITRTHPDKMRERYDIKTPIIWLSRSKDYAERVDPTDLISLAHTIREFIGKGSKSVVLLEGLEYLITQNSFDDVLKLVQSLNDSIAPSKSRLIVPFNPGVLEQQQIALLGKECKHLDFSKKKSAK